MLLKKICFAALLALSCTPVFSQALYKISGKGLQQPGYLFGTIHLICPNDLSISPALKEAVDKAKSIYLELDLDDPAVLTTYMASMQPREGYNLAQYFTADEFARLTAFMKDSLKASVTNLRQQSPMTVQMQILQHAVPCKIPASYEVELIKMATTQQKPILGLEALADQLAIFDAIPDSVESRMIMEYVDNFKEQRRLFAQVVASYKKQDITGIHRLFSEAADWKGYEDVMVNNRNRNWVPVIAKALQQGPVLIACGAMHLAGGQGLLALLKAQGYEVTPVP